MATAPCANGAEGPMPRLWRADAAPAAYSSKQRQVLQSTEWATEERPSPGQRDEDASHRWRCCMVTEALRLASLAPVPGKPMGLDPRPLPVSEAPSRTLYRASVPQCQLLGG